VTGALNEHFRAMSKYLVFDFDGVIGDTREASAHATASVDGTSHEAALAENLRYASEKPNHARDHNLTDAELQQVYEWTVAFGANMHDSNFSLFTDFVAEVETLPTPYKAVVSSGSQLYVIPALAKTNIQPTHILAYENHHSKEEKIETIAKDWSADLSEMYYFTDTLADYYELKELLQPEKLIGVGWGYCGYEALAEVMDEQYILKKAEDIHSVL
jgi:phosphoglycolate phosphatase-like HAD superfamily hydrolase